MRQVAQARCEGEAREAARRALIEALAAVYPGGRLQLIQPLGRGHGGWMPLHSRWSENAAALAQGVDEQAGYILDRLASYRHGALAAYAEARPLYERALAIHEKVLGPEHPDTAMSLNNLALLLQAQGDLRRRGRCSSARWRSARRCSAPSIPIRRRASTTSPPCCRPRATWRRRGRCSSARWRSTRRCSAPSIPIRRRASTISPTCFRLQGELAAARPLFERALAIYEKVLGPEHPYTAASLNNLASLLQAQGDLAAARPLFERALAIREKVLGPEHPDTALLHRDAGQVSVGEKVLGPRHPAGAARWSNLACLLRDAGRTEEAEPLFLRAIAIGDKALGAGHPLTQRYQSNYARLLLMTNRAVEALQRGQAALATHEQVNGSNHLWTKDSARVTADALDALGREPRGGGAAGGVWDRSRRQKLTIPVEK